MPLHEVTVGEGVSIRSLLRGGVEGAPGIEARHALIVDSHGGTNFIFHLFIDFSPSSFLCRLILSRLYISLIFLLFLSPERLSGHYSSKVIPSCICPTVRLVCFSFFVLSSLAVPTGVPTK